MNNLMNNKKTIIICVILVILVLSINYLVTNKSLFNNSSKKNNILIEKYDANQIVPIYVSDAEMANKYLNDFKNLMLNDINAAYDVINNSYKKKKYGSFENFQKNIQDEYSVEFYRMNVKEYSAVNKNGYKFYYIRNNRDDLYIFKELSIMNYEVFLDEYTVEIK